jgi:hypothetical protein
VSASSCPAQPLPHTVCVSLSVVGCLKCAAFCFRRANQQSTEEQKAALAAFGDDFQQALNKDTEALMANIGSLLSGFVAAKKEMVSQALGAASIKADSSLTDLEGSMGSICECAEAQVAALATAKEAAGVESQTNVTAVKVRCDCCHVYCTLPMPPLGDCLCYNASLCVLQESVSDLQRVVETSIAGAAAVGERVKENSALAIASLSQHTEAAASMVMSAHNELASGAEQAVTELTSGAEKGASISSELTDSLDAAGKADTAFFTATRDVASECSEHINNFCDANAAEISALSMTIQVSNNVMLCHAPTQPFIITPPV